MRWRVAQSTAALSLALLAVACAASCGPSAEDMRRCDGPGQCVALPKGCCGAPCGAVDLADFDAIHFDYMRQFREESCRSGGDCPLVDCNERSDAGVFAECQGGTCVARNLAAEPLSSCQVPEECRLRFGVGCCESCEGTAASLVAARLDAEEALRAAVCRPGDACGICRPEPPEGARADCVEGRCVVDL